MTQTFKRKVQQQLNEKSLTDQQLKKLQALQENTLAQQNKRTVDTQQIWYKTWYKTSAIASVLMVAVLSIYLMNVTHESTASIEQRIAEEVASYHLKLKPLEVTANNMADITAYFKQLTFAPVTPASVPLSEQSLLGGRYCSIQGVTALQLRVHNEKTNKVQSLYEAEYDKKVFKDFPKLAEGSQPITIYVKGLKVDMWTEKDILFALIE